MKNTEIRKLVRRWRRARLVGMSGFKVSHGPRAAKAGSIVNGLADGIFKEPYWKTYLWLAADAFFFPQEHKNPIPYPEHGGY